MVALVFDASARAPSGCEPHAVTPDAAGPRPDMKAEALALAALGFAIFPCQKGGKRPVGWLAPHGCRDVTSDPEVIKQWWTLGDWNVGIATDGGVVLDVDPRNGGDASLQKLLDEHGALPPTWTVKTGGGGGHLYFARPAGLPIGCRKDGLPPGIDIKAAGGYVIAPPSLHASGNRYAWHTHPAGAPLAQMPEWLVELCRKTKDATAIGAQQRGGWADFIKGHVLEGGRNDALTRLAGYLFWRAVDRDVILHLVWGWNQTHCTPPLADEELKRIVVSIYEREQRRRMAIR